MVTKFQTDESDEERGDEPPQPREYSHRRLADSKSFREVQDEFKQAVRGQSPSGMTTSSNGGDSSRKLEPLCPIKIFDELIQCMNKDFGKSYIPEMTIVDQRI